MRIDIVQAFVAEGHQAHTTFAQGTNIQVMPADDSLLEMGEGTISTGSAAFAQAPVAVLAARGELPLAFCTVLVPYADSRELPVVEKIPASNPLVRKICLKFPNGQRDEIAFAPEVRPLHLSEKEGHGRAYLVRRGPAANATVEMDGPIP